MRLFAPAAHQSRHEGTGHITGTLIIRPDAGQRGNAVFAKHFVVIDGEKRYVSGNGQPFRRTRLDDRQRTIVVGGEDAGWLWQGLEPIADFREVVYGKGRWPKKTA